ncbi:MAG: hypothetical protein WC460_00400 [Patescibacteria group bacterium]
MRKIKELCSFKNSETKKENVQMEEKEIEEVEKERIVVVEKRGCGCLIVIINLILTLIVIPFGLYLGYNWQLNKAKQARQESNDWVVKELMQVSDRIYDLSNLEITETNSQPAKAFFVFYRKDPKGNTQTTLDLEAYRLSGGVFKIYTPPIEIVIGLPTAYWLNEHLIEPQLPIYSYLIATPYSLEFCDGAGSCKLLKKTVGFTNENGKFSYYF